MKYLTAEGTEEETDNGGKLVFKKPIKRPSNALDFNVKKKSKGEEGKSKKKDKKKGVKNQKLLSFNNEDEET